MTTLQIIGSVLIFIGIFGMFFPIMALTKNKKTPKRGKGYYVTSGHVIVKRFGTRVDAEFFAKMLMMPKEVVSEYPERSVISVWNRSSFRDDYSLEWKNGKNISAGVFVNKCCFIDPDAIEE